MAQEPVEDDGRWDGDATELSGWLRPAQAGVALAGTARPAHIAATLVDLEIRGHLTIEQTTDGEGGVDWVLARRGGRAGPKLAWFGSGDVVVQYERVLLSVLPRRQAIRLSEASDAKRWKTALATVYRQLNREAVSRGFIRPAQPADQTGQLDDARESGAATAVATVRAFRSYLTRLQPTGTDARDRFREYLPYAVAFGLTPEWAERFAVLESSASVAAGSYGFAGNDQTLALGAVFANAACTHIHSAVGHGGSGSWGGHTGGHGYGGHGGHDG